MAERANRPARRFLVRRAGQMGTLERVNVAESPGESSTEDARPNRGKRATRRDLRKPDLDAGAADAGPADPKHTWRGTGPHRRGGYRVGAPLRRRQRRAVDQRPAYDRG